MQARFPGVRLVAVSKTKPPEAVSVLYDAGQRHFGENYVSIVRLAGNTALFLAFCVRGPNRGPGWCPGHWPACDAMFAEAATKMCTVFVFNGFGSSLLPRPVRDVVKKRVRLMAVDGVRVFFRNN